MTGEIFRDSNGFGVSYHFVGMIMTVPAWPRAETKQLLCSYIVQRSCFANPFPRFLVLTSLINIAFD